MSFDEYSRQLNEILARLKRLEEANTANTFRVEFAIHLKYDRGETSFRREEQLPFVPFIGMEVLDDAVGEFEIRHVAWANGCDMLLCQSKLDMRHWPIREACRRMKEAGWTEERECRQPD